MALDLSVSLDGLNAKAMAKEFKTVAKAMRSKDETIRQSALDRFAADPRYLTEGGCMVPLLEAIQPKKKTLEFSRIALKSLLDFLDKAKDNQESSPALLSLNSVYETSGNLDPLQMLSCLLVYKDEVKKVKEVKVKVKKGEPVPEPVPPPVIPESDLSLELRANSLRAMYLFAEALNTFPAYLSPERVLELKRAFSFVPGLSTVTHSVTLTTATRLSNPEDASESEQEVVQHGIWAMECLTLVMRFNEDATRNLFVDNVEGQSLAISDLLAVLSQSEALVLYCLQILDLLAINGAPSCLQIVTQPENLALMVKAVETAATASASVQRENVLQMASVVKTLTFLAEKSGEVFAVKGDNGLQLTTRTVTAISSFVQNRSVWDICRVPDRKQLDTPLLTCLDSCGIFLGSLAKISDDVRKESCNTGGCLEAMLSILQDSDQIVGTPVPAFTALSLNADNASAEETEALTDALKQTRLRALRRVIEQALLLLLTSRTSIAHQTSSLRWHSCADFSTDETMLSSDSPAQFSTNILFGIIGTLEDPDLSNRGVRVLSALLQGSADAKAVLDLIKFDTTVASNLSDAVYSLGNGYLESITPKEDGEESSSSTSALSNGSFFSPAEALYQSLTVLEFILQQSSDNVNTFANSDRVKMLANLLLVCGPSSVDSSKTEAVANLNDPRRLSWIVSVDALDPCLSADILLRPIIFDVLALVAAADAKFRTFDFEIPINSDLPDSNSPCTSAALTVCELCADACIATLSYSVEFRLLNDCILAVPTTLSDFAFSEQVLNAALRLAASIASVGKSGLTRALQTIADLAFASEDEAESLPPSSMSQFKVFLSGVTPTVITDVKSADDGNTEGIDASAPSSVFPTSYTWTAPSTFTDAIARDDVMPSSLSILSSNHCLWPVVSFCCPIVGILADPRHSSETSALALLALQASCKTPQQLDASQPVIQDVITCTFLSLGGAVALLGAAGAFGNLGTSSTIIASENIISIASDILSRGKTREMYWLEFVDGGGVDPNAGPNSNTWRTLFSLVSDDLHGRCQASSPLLAAVHNILPDLALRLIEHSSDVNMLDGASLSPLNYALILGMADVTRALIDKSSNINYVDSEGNPIIAYSFLTLMPEDVPRGAAAASDVGSVANKLGSAPLLNLLLQAKVDVRIADASGCPPLMMAMGLAHKTVQIGGYKMQICSNSYKPQCELEEIVRLGESLLVAGAEINFCNKKCVTGLHIAAAQGHVEMIDLLLRRGASPNVLDCQGFLPIHYIAAACPMNAIAAFDLLLKGSSDHPVQRLVFEDCRTGKTEEEKIMVDIDGAFRNIFSAAMAPSSIETVRHNAKTVLLMCADNGMNALQLCQTAHHLQNEAFVPFIVGDKHQRMALAIWLASQDPKSLLSYVTETTGTTVLHTACLLLQGITDKRELTAAEKRSKRVKYYPSLELNLLDDVFTHSSFDALNAVSSLAVKEIPCLPAAWTPLHAAIAADNSDLVVTLLEKGVDIAQAGTNYAHFLVSCNASRAVCEAIISACAASASYSALLNSVAETGNTECSMKARPLHIASRRGNTAALEVLTGCRKVDLNIRDEESGLTAIYEAVQRSDLELIDSFAATAADRIDLLVEDASGNTCVEVAIEGTDLDVLNRLLAMRKNDVIERVLLVRNDCDSMLVQLEKENMRLAVSCGLAPDLKDIAAPVADSVVVDGSVEMGIEMEMDMGTEEMKSEQLVDASAADGGVSEEKEEVNSPPPPVIQVSPHDLALLSKSNALCMVLVKALQGLVDLDVHAHPCFHEGRLYRDAGNY